jgi:hypothetical protein
MDFGKHVTTPLNGIFIVYLIVLLNGPVKQKFFPLWPGRINLEQYTGQTDKNGPYI